MFLVSPEWDPDQGYEMPEGRVVAPGRYTLVELDPEWREFVDEGLMEVPERHLVKIQ